MSSCRPQIMRAFAIYKYSPPTPLAKVFFLLLRLGGIFQKPLAAAIAGTVLCISTLGVFVTAVVLANNDRLAKARVERADRSADEQHEAVSDSCALDDTTTPQAEEGEEDVLEARGLHLVIQEGGDCPLPHDDYGARVDEESKDSDEAGSPSSWLARVVGGNLCAEDPKNAEDDEAL